jgi:hypothetical protein
MLGDIRNRKSLRDLYPLLHRHLHPRPLLLHHLREIRPLSHSRLLLLHLELGFGLLLHYRLRPRRLLLELLRRPGCARVDVEKCKRHGEGEDEMGRMWSATRT